MNAFMIFARRRRPQVSAENQAMRTGEISKILSKEWVAMSPVNNALLPPATAYFCLTVYTLLRPTSNSTLSKRSS